MSKRDHGSPFGAENRGRNPPVSDVRFDLADGFLEAELRRRELCVRDRDIELFALLHRFARTAVKLLARSGVERLGMGAKQQRSVSVHRRGVRRRR